MWRAGWISTWGRVGDVNGAETEIARLVLHLHAEHRVPKSNTARQNIYNNISKLPTAPGLPFPFATIQAMNVVTAQASPCKAG